MINELYTQNLEIDLSVLCYFFQTVGSDVLINIFL